MDNENRQTAKEPRKHQRQNRDAGTDGSELTVNFAGSVENHEPPKRRGRPKGSKNKPKNQEENITNETRTDSEEKWIGTVSEKVTVKAKRGRPKKQNFMSIEEASTTANFIVDTAEGFAVQFFGDDGRLNFIEASLIRTSLPKLLTTLEVSTVDKASGILTPLALLAGCGMYGLRLFKLAASSSDTEEISLEDILQPVSSEILEKVKEVSEVAETEPNSFHPDLWETRGLDH